MALLAALEELTQAQRQSIDAAAIQVANWSWTARLSLLAFGALRLGFLAYFLSHPVISGFITGSAVLIAVGQLKHILGVKVAGSDVLQVLHGLATALPQTQPVTLAIGLASLLFLWAARRYMARALEYIGLGARTADLLAKLAPMVAVIASTAVVGLLRLDQSVGVSVVGAVPQGLQFTADWYKAALAESKRLR